MVKVLKTIICRKPEDLPKLKHNFGIVIPAKQYIKEREKKERVKNLFLQSLDKKSDRKTRLSKLVKTLSDNGWKLKK